MKNNNKKIIIIFFIIILIFIILNNFLYLFLNNKYRKNYNEKINNIIYELNKKYPELKKEEIILILNNNNNINENILIDYGINLEKDFIDLNNEKEFVDDPFLDEKEGILKPNVRYKTGEYDYFYETDSQGRILHVVAEKLQLTKRLKRLIHKRNTSGKLKGDHAGHLIGDQFGGSPDLDNLVSQLQKVNQSQYKRLENMWSKALKAGGDVSVDIDVIYQGSSSRPAGFKVYSVVNGKIVNKFISNGGK